MSSPLPEPTPEIAGGDKVSWTTRVFSRLKSRVWRKTGSPSTVTIFLEERFPRVFLMDEKTFRAYSHFISSGAEREPVSLFFGPLVRRPGELCLSARQTLNPSKSILSRLLNIRGSNERTVANSNNSNAVLSAHVRIFDCGSNAARFLGADFANLSRFPSDHGTAPVTTEVLFREVAEILDWLAEDQQNNLAVCLFGNLAHSTAVMNLLELIWNNASGDRNYNQSAMQKSILGFMSRRSPLKSEERALTSAKDATKSRNKLDLSISIERRQEAMSALWRIYTESPPENQVSSSAVGHGKPDHSIKSSRANDSERPIKNEHLSQSIMENDSLPRGIRQFPDKFMLTKVMLDCDYKALRDLWGIAEAKRLGRSRRSTNNAEYLANRLLSPAQSDGAYSPTVMITDGGSVVYFSSTALSRSPATESLVGARVDKPVTGDITTRVFVLGEGTATSSSPLAQSGQQRRREVASLWFHTGLLSRAGFAFLPGDEVVVRFDFASDLDKPRRIARELRGTKRTRDSGDRVMCIYLAFEFNDAVQRGKLFGNRKLEMCPRCFCISIINGTDEKRCRCARVEVPLASDDFLGGSSAVLRSGSNSDEDESDEEDYEEAKVEELHPALNHVHHNEESILLLHQMFPEVGIDEINSLSEGLNLEDESDFNALVAQLACYGDKTKRDDDIVVKVGEYVQTPVGIGIVEELAHMCVMDDQLMPETLESVRVKFPFGVGYIQANQVHSLFHDKSPAQIGRKSAMEAQKGAPELPPRSSSSSSKPRATSPWSTIAQGISASANTDETDFWFGGVGNSNAPRSAPMTTSPVQRRFAVRYSRSPFDAFLQREHEFAFNSHTRNYDVARLQSELDAMLAQQLQDEDFGGSVPIPSSSAKSYRGQLLDSLPVTTYEESPKANRSGGKNRKSTASTTLSKRKQKELDEFSKKCLVCQHEFVQGDTIRTLPCFHRFHAECVDPWLMGHHKCPLCKLDIASAMAPDPGGSTGE